MQEYTHIYVYDEKGEHYNIGLSGSICKCGYSDIPNYSLVSENIVGKIRSEGDRPDHLLPDVFPYPCNTHLKLCSVTYSRHKFLGIPSTKSRKIRDIIKNNVRGGGRGIKVDRKRNILSGQITLTVSKTQNLSCLELGKQFKLSDEVLYCQK